MNKNLIIIAAVSMNGVIGVDGKIPWHISEDLIHFRLSTIDNVVIVGYNTYISLPPKALEGRIYLVLNAGNYFENKCENVYQFSRLDVLLSFIDYHPEIFLDKKIFVAGGAMVYDGLIDYCNEAIITWINIECPDGNKFFPMEKFDESFNQIDVDWYWNTSVSGIEYCVKHYIRL